MEGNVKTRLAKSIGDKKALLIYRALLEKTRDEVKTLEVTKKVYYSNYVEKKDLWSPLSVEKGVQVEGDLGERMLHAFEEGFKAGFTNIVVIGTDLWSLNKSLLQQAFDALTTHDYVIGPAQDGGYYLLGMKKLNKGLFENKSWSTSGLYKETIKEFSQLPYHTLPLLNDIDTIEDLEAFPELRILIN